MTVFSRLLSRLERAREAREWKRQKEARLSEAIQRVVQLSAPVVCSLRDCRRDLRSPVETAVAYIDQTIALIPGPLPLSPAIWDRHPLLQALFADAEEIKTLLTRDRCLKSFLDRQPAPRAYALLTATKRERTIFGTAVEGEILRRDVAQTAVDFRDHRILDPAATEAETRYALQTWALTALVNQVLERALRLRSIKDELREQQRILSIQLKIRQTRPHSLDASASEERESDSSGASADWILADIDRQIRDLSAASDSPEAYWDQLTAVLNAPQAVLTVNPVAMRLNWMGVKQCGTSPECSQEIRLAEVALKDHMKRVAVFVSIERADGTSP